MYRQWDRKIRSPTGSGFYWANRQGKMKQRESAPQAKLSRFPGKTGSPTGSRFCGAVRAAGVRLQATRAQ